MHPHFRFILLAAVALALTMTPLLTSCSDEPEQARTCASSEDCQDDERCISGYCVSTVTYSCDEGEGCPDGWECHEDGFCRAARVERASSSCAGAGECHHLEVCVAGRCSALSCAGDEQCPVDSLCIGTRCRHAPLCETDGDCPYGACGPEGRCLAGCESNSECGGTPATLCDAGACANRCLSDGSCRPGQRCVDEVCRAEECRGFSELDCPVGERCNGSGKCEPVRGCAADEECVTGERCIDEICEAATPCERDADCAFDAGEFCAENRCAQGRECSAVAQGCLPDESCAAGYCVPGGCLSDDQCFVNQMCDGGRCVSATPGDVVTSLRLVPMAPHAHPPELVGQWRVIALDADGRPVSPRLLNLDMRVEPPEVMTTELVPGALDVFRTLPFTPNAEGDGAVDDDDLAPDTDIELVARSGELEVRYPLWIAGDAAGEPNGPGAPNDSAVDSGANDATGEPSTSEDTRRWRVLVLDAHRGSPIEDASLRSPFGEVHTDAAGRAVIDEGDEPQPTDFVLEIAHDLYRAAWLLDPPAGPLVIQLTPDQGSATDWALRSERMDTSEGGLALLQGFVAPNDLSALDVHGLFGAPSLITEPDLSSVTDAILTLPAALLLQLSFLDVDAVQDETVTRRRSPPRGAWQLGATVNPSRLIDVLGGEEERGLLSVLHASAPLLTGLHAGLEVIPNHANTPDAPIVLPGHDAVHLRRIVELPADTQRERAFLLYVLEHPWIGPVPLGFSAVPESGPALLRNAAPPGWLVGGTPRILLIEGDEGEGVFGEELARFAPTTRMRALSPARDETVIPMRSLGAAPSITLEDDVLFVADGDLDDLTAIIRADVRIDGRPAQLWLPASLWYHSADAFTAIGVDTIDEFRIWRLEDPDDKAALWRGEVGTIFAPSALSSSFSSFRFDPDP